MTASNFILPRALLKALGPAPDGEDLKAIIVDLAAGDRIEAVAQYVNDHRHIDHVPNDEQLITAHQWQRVVHQNKVEDVWKNGTVRLDSDLKNHLYYLEIVGIKFDETQVREALTRFGLTLNTKPSVPDRRTPAPPKSVEQPADKSESTSPSSQAYLPPLDEVASVSVRHAALHLNAGRTNIYERIKDGTLHSAKVGARTVITTASIKKLLESRESTKTD
jgi:hypothetical protein